ncbi:MAG: hypothetical protein E7547_01890 [Ruminococcaceae bacterium]|nr:hypothetical protein [Oscillospiraceae bacterium]
MMKKLRILSLIALLITTFVSVDLGVNLLYNLFWEYHDGIAVNSILHGLFGIFGDSMWSVERFFDAFKTSVWISFLVFAENIVLAIVDFSKKK